MNKLWLGYRFIKRQMHGNKIFVIQFCDTILFQNSVDIPFFRRYSRAMVSGGIPM